MTEIRRVLKQAAWRLLLVDVLRNLSLTASVAVGALIVTLLAQRVLGLAISFPQDWVRLGAGALGAAVLAALVWSVVRRARGMGLARIVDERADLRESLSTAMFVSRSQDPWASVVVETAREKAKRVDVRRAIPIVAPRLWFVPPALMLSLVILWFSVPNWDVLGALSQRQAEQNRLYQVEQVKADIRRNEEKLEELLRKAGVDLEKEESTEAGKDAQAPQNPDEVRRAAIRRLTSLQDRLGAMKQGDDAQKMNALKQMMRQLRTPPGPAEQMSRALAQGNFAQAQQELQKLAQQMSSGNMSPEDQAKLQQQMQQLAQQMQQLAESRTQLEQQLKQAGMSSEQAQQAARDPEALKRALEQMENLTDEQKQKLAEMAKALQQAAEQCNGMGEAMAQMAAGLSESGMSQEGMEGLENLAGQLGAMEMMQADLASMDAAMSEAMRQLSQLGSQQAGKPGNCGGDCSGEGSCDGTCAGECDGDGAGGVSPWRLGEARGQGKGTGGPGQGGGVRNWEDVDAPVNIEKVKSPTKQGEGPIIGTRLVQGDQVRGESVAEFASVVESSRKVAAESLDTMIVPRELHPAVKTYFGRLEARAKAQRPAEAPAAEQKKDEGR
jgi:hypothetical protein